MADSPSDSGKLDAVLVGLGRSGAELHIPILHKLSQVNPRTPFRRVAAIVDIDSKKLDRAYHRLSDDYNYPADSVVRATSIAALTSVDPQTVVVHICTPAKDHLDSVKAAAEAGFRRFIVEKPCAGSAESVTAMLRLAEQQTLSIAVVNPYLYSESVAKCKKAIEARTTPNYIEFELSKPRKSPTLQQRSSAESVFDVELPHQIATVLHLLQPVRYAVLRADVRDMHYKQANDPCIVVNNMGLGIITLQLDTTVAVLVSYLDAYTRTRALRVRFNDHEEIVANLPVTEEDHTAEIVTFGSPDENGYAPQAAKEKYADDLFTSCLDALYTRLSTQSFLATDLEFNQRVVNIMDQAKALSRVRKFART